MSLSDKYTPKEFESRLYKWWNDKGYFKADDKSKKPPFSIILPPPNVTGQLHIGHALNHTLQDLLIRYKRMSGFNAMWLPGTDHAGRTDEAASALHSGSGGNERAQVPVDKRLCPRQQQV